MMMMMVASEEEEEDHQQQQQQPPSNKLDCGGGGGGGPAAGGMVVPGGLHGAEASALQLKIKNSICKSVQSKVDSILQDVEKFTDIEKLYLYLKLPSGPNPSSEKSSEQSSMSSSRTQQVHAFNWICNNLEEHPETSLPKQEVYDEYKSYCDNLNYHPLSAADFGKIMKNVFPNMKARRLGMRGKSKYCYSGLRKRPFVHMPSLPNLELHKTMDGQQCDSVESSGQLPGAPGGMKEEVQSAACGLVCEWAQKVLSRQFDAVEDLARFLLNSHYISNKSMAALTIMTNTGVESPQTTSAFVPTNTAESHSFQPQASTLPSPSVDAKQQLQRKIHRKQQEQKLHSPPPQQPPAGGDAHHHHHHQAKKAADEGTPGTGSAARDSPRLLSPQPTIGIVVATVPSPVTVQRNRQLMSPSPVGTGPVNFQVLTPTVQSVRLSPHKNLPHNILYSPTGDRTARQRYAQILPKPSATSAIAHLRSPPGSVLIANSPIKTTHVIPTCHVTSVNVVKMTTVTLASPNASSTATSITSSGGGGSAARPSSAGVNASRAGGAEAEFRPSRPQPLRSGSAAPLLAPVARQGWASAVTPPVDVEMEAIHEKSQQAHHASGGRREGAAAPPRGGGGGAAQRAASVPALQMRRGSLGLEEMSSRPSSTTSAVAAATAGGNNNNNAGRESPSPAQNTRPASGINGGQSSAKEGFLSTKGARKRSGLSPVSHLSPVKRVFISQQPFGGCAPPRNAHRPVALLRPESAPAIGRFPVKLNLNSTAAGTAAQGLANPPLGVRASGFQTVAKTHGPSSSSSAQQRTNTSSGVVETQQHQHHSSSSSSSLSVSDPQGELMSAAASAERDLEGGQQQQQQRGGGGGHMFMQHVEQSGGGGGGGGGTQQAPPLHLLGQAAAAAASGQLATHAELDYFTFDDDMTQDSIVEELVQMEEQMKLNNSMQEFGGNCGGGGGVLGGQLAATTMQGGGGSSAMSSGGQSMTSFYGGGGSSAPIQTPTPTPCTPTPTSEMMGGGGGGQGSSLTRESPYSRNMASSVTPVDSALGSSRQHTPVCGTPHSNCSSTVPQSPVECRNPFAFTPINSNTTTSYHDNVSVVSSSPVKPMQRPTATHPDKAKLDWMSSSYSNNTGINNLPSYQDLVDDHFQKPHAFAVPGQSCLSQARHNNNNNNDGHFGRLTPISPVQQQVASMAAMMSKQEGFAVPSLPLDNKAAAQSGVSGSPGAAAAFRCRSVSPAVRQRNLSGSTGNPAAAAASAACPGGVPRSVVSPSFNSPVTPEVLHIFANSQPPDDALSAANAAQRSRSVPVNVMMQTELPPGMQGGPPQRSGQKIADVLLSKMEGDRDDSVSVRGLGVNNVHSSYTACMNLTQILESGPPAGMPCTTTAKQHSANNNNNAYGGFHKTNYLMKNATTGERFLLAEGQSRAAAAAAAAPGERQQQGLQPAARPLLLQQQQRQNQELMQQQQQNQELMQQNRELMHQQQQNQELMQQQNQQLMQQQQQQNQGLMQQQQNQQQMQQQQQNLQQMQQQHQNLQQMQQQGQPSPLLLQQHQNQQLHFSSAVKQLLTDDGLHPGNPLAEAGVSELDDDTGGGGGAGGFLPGDVRNLTSDLIAGNINDLNALDANLLFDPGQHHGGGGGQFADTTPEELMNDPLFQQICNETANSSGFDWLESKDHPTVGLMG